MVRRDLIVAQRLIATADGIYGAALRLDRMQILATALSHYLPIRPNLRCADAAPSQVNEDAASAEANLLDEGVGDTVIR